MKNSSCSTSRSSTQVGTDCDLRARLRWNHPVARTVSSPVDIFRSHEDIGVSSCRLGPLILSAKACMNGTKWPEAVIRRGHVSPQHFHSLDLFDEVRYSLRVAVLPANRLRDRESP